MSSLWMFYISVGSCLHVLTLSHLSKEFISARKEAARSIEPEKEVISGNSANFDVGTILCEKYGDWSKWSPCSRKCEQTRVRECRKPEECGKSWVKEKRTCVRDSGACSPLSYKVIGIQKRNRLIEELLYDLLYSPWTHWGSCSRSCTQRRQRKCKLKAICIRSYIQEERRCQAMGSECEHRFILKPLGMDNLNSSQHMIVVDSENVIGGDRSYDDEYGEEDYEPDGDKMYAKGGQDNPQIINNKGSHNNASDLSSIDDNTERDNTEKDNTERDNTEKDNTERDNTEKEQWISTIEKTNDNESEEKERKGSAFGEEVTTIQKNCGIRPLVGFGSYRVVGGQEVHRNSWPWQVAIMTKYQEQYCGGTLIAPRWVLTAAHCVRKKGKRRKLMVRVGEHDISEYEPSQEDIRSEQEFPHPDFDYHTITNDIALIKLRHPPSAFSLPGFACLPTVNYTPPRDDLCTIVGWGKLKNTHYYGSRILHETQVPVVRHRKCKRVFDYVISQKQICAGYKKGGKDSCAGDSGGPLLCPWKDGSTTRYVLYGVTSYGEGCGRKGKYGIYTKVASYKDWIEKVIRENS